MEHRMEDGGWPGWRDPHRALLPALGTWAPGRLTVVHRDHVQAVQELPLVLVDPLHLHVEHGGRIDLHLVLLLQELRKLQLVLLSRQCTVQESFQLRNIRWSLYTLEHKPSRQVLGKEPAREASPASRWRFPGGRRHRPGSCAASSAGSSLSRSLPQFSLFKGRGDFNQGWQSKPNERFLSPQ